MAESQQDTFRSSLTNIVEVIMAWPLKVIPTSKSIAIRCGKSGCDEVLGRFVKTQIITMEAISRLITRHMTTCLSNRRVYPE